MSSKLSNLIAYCIEHGYSAEKGALELGIYLPDYLMERANQLIRESEPMTGRVCPECFHRVVVEAHYTEEHEDLLTIYWYKCPVCGILFNSQETTTLEEDLDLECDMCE